MQRLPRTECVVLGEAVSNFMKEFLSWEKTIIYLSTVFILILIIVGFFLFPILEQTIETSGPKKPEILKLGFSGWFGFVGFGTIINLVALAVRSLSKK